MSAEQKILRARGMRGNASILRFLLIRASWNRGTCKAYVLRVLETQGEGEIVPFCECQVIGLDPLTHRRVKVLATMLQAAQPVSETRLMKEAAMTSPEVHQTS